jgi:putative hemolysin
MILSLAAIIIAVLLIGFFSGVEIAFISSNKLSFELFKKQGKYAGKIWGEYAETPTKFIGTLLVIVIVLLVIFGLLISDLLYPLWRMVEVKLNSSLAKYVKVIKLFFEVAVSSFIILFSTVIFKAFFRAKNKTILNTGFVAYIVQFFYSIFSPVASMFESMAEWILEYVFNIKVSSKKEENYKTDLENFVQQTKIVAEENNSSSEINKEMFENALSLGEVKLRECLVPRKEIMGISKNSTIEELKSLFIETRLSRLVVFGNNTDTIEGYVHHLDLFKNPTTIEQILLPIPTVPETMTATDLMTKFSKDRKSIAWVIDEFGGTAGIVTMEDLLEEIFGDIKDEYDDAEEFVDKQLSLTEYLFSGRVELDFISQKYGLEFPEDETAETLSGFIVQHNEDIPKEKQQIIIGNYEFDILSMSDTKIETVKLKVLRK